MQCFYRMFIVELVKKSGLMHPYNAYGVSLQICNKQSMLDTLVHSNL